MACCDQLTTFELVFLDFFACVGILAVYWWVLWYLK
jgi:hypothetical protein